jgi:hypothetical protein
MTGAELEQYQQKIRGPSDIEGHVGWIGYHARGNIMEIGVRDGYSTAAILIGLEQNREGGHLWSVDKEDCGHLYSNPRWTFIQANSLTESERILDATNMKSNGLWIDLLLIDGDHSYAGCLSDLTNFGRYAKIIAVHDTNSQWLGVWQAVTEYFRSPFSGAFRRAEFRNQSNGLGVLYR